MTVKELKTMLSKYPDDTLVVTHGYEDGYDCVGDETDGTGLIMVDFESEHNYSGGVVGDHLDPDDSKGEAQNLKEVLLLSVFKRARAWRLNEQKSSKWAYKNGLTP